MSIIIQTEDESEFHINPDALISQSKYFIALFQYDNQPRILIRGVSGDTMKQILSYIGKGTMVLDGNSILNILEAADYLMLDNVLQEAISALPNEITPSNCIDFFHVALNLDHLDIFRLCYCYIQTHFESVVKYSNIGNMSFEHLKAFLADEHLNISNEETVFRAIAKWIERDEQERVRFLPALLVCVRLSACDEQCLRTIMNHPFVLNSKILSCDVGKFNSADCKTSFIQAAKDLDASKSMCFGPRQHVICAITSNYMKSDVDCSLELSMLSSEAKTITTFPVKLKVRPDYVFSTCHQRTVFVYYASEDEFLCFDLLTSTWRTVTSPRELGHAVLFIGTIKNRIYVVVTNFRTWGLHVAVYDPHQNTWKELQSVLPIHGPIIGPFAVTVHEGSIYIAIASVVDLNRIKFGGIFNPETNTWTQFCLPEIMSRYFTLISLEGLLLMIHCQVMTVQRFYPEDGVWRQFKHLPHIYNDPQAVIRNRIPFIYENFVTAEDKNLHPIYFDLKADKWYDGSKLLYAPDYYVIEDADIVRKYHRQLMEDRWTSLSRNWNQTDLYRCADFVHVTDSPMSQLSIKY